MTPIAVFVAVSALPVAAKNINSKDIQTMDTVVVTGSSPKSINDIPGSVWVVNGMDIEEEYKGGKDLSAILSSKVPALDIGSGGRTSYGQNLRGRKMLVMIDGVSLNSSRSISRQLDSIDPFNIDKVEILSGATSVYGAGATGGVINIITKKGESGKTRFESYVSTSSGFNASDDYDYKLAQSISGGTDNMFGRVSVVYGKNNGFYDAKGTIVTPDTTQGSLQFNDMVDLQATTTIMPDDDKTITFLAQYYNSQQDSPYGLYFGKDFEDASDPEVREGFDSDRNMGTERYMFNAQYHDADILGHELLLQGSYRKEVLTSTPYFYGDYLAASEQTTDVVSMRAAMIKSFEKAKLTYGFEGYIDKLKSDQAIFDQSTSFETGGLVNKTSDLIGRYPGTEVQGLAAFIQGSYDITDAWKLEAGYRYQYVNNKINDFVKASIQKEIAMGNGTSADMLPGGENNYGLGLFNIGTIYKLTDKSQVWANFSQGYDLADPAKNYGRGDYTLIGDHWTLDSAPDINNSTQAGIKTDSYEIGMRQELGDFTWQGAAYYSYSNKRTKINSDFTIDLINDPKRVYGLEADVSYWLSQNWQAGVSGNLVKSEQKNTESGKWEKMSAADASASKAGAWLGWYEDSYSVKLQSQTLFNLSDDQGQSIDGYTLFDLVGSVDLPKGTLGFGIQNLLNEEYTTIWGQRATFLYNTNPASMFDYKGRGRTFSLNYSLRY
ncbi:ferric aerobactin receptor precursor [Photobacterium sp. SKA34]|uniref:TonB-dependent receptor n=1 Tax=Photobacterium sp. SKA34 TaxID=121723 RepID=UPI00006B89E9|nr:ferric aerobactin receptor precursor [Photobacterium sp. SKA34]